MNSDGFSFFLTQIWNTEANIVRNTFPTPTHFISQ